MREWGVAWFFGMALLVASHAMAQDVLIRGARVHTVGTRGTLEETDVLVRNGRIASIGKDLQAPAGTDIVEANGRPLTPGLFGGLSNMGLIEAGLEVMTTETTFKVDSPRWEQQWRPEFDVTLAFSPRTTLMPIARIEGITWSVLNPGSPFGGDGIIGGQGAAVTFNGRFDAFLPGSESLFIGMDTSSKLLSGGTRAGHFMLLEQAIGEARGEAVEGTPMLLHAEGRRVLRRYLKGGRVVFNTNRAADIRQVLAFAKRHGIKPVISGATEAPLVADLLLQQDVPVLFDPLDNLPIGFDRMGARPDNAARLQRAGIRIAFTTWDTHHMRKIRQLAGNAVAHGLPWDAALAALTANPAEIFGQGGQRGRIEVGYVADLVLWSGDPLEITTLARNVWIAGRAFEMTSRQKLLRDRYLAPAAGAPGAR